MGRKPAKEEGIARFSVLFGLGLLTAAAIIGYLFYAVPSVSIAD
jgi:hypothetical protein